MQSSVAIFTFIAIVFVLAFIVVICCRIYFFIHLRRKLRAEQAPIVVTSQTHTTATGYPATVQATPSGGFQATQYPTAMPMPQATGPYSNPPYPMGVGAQGMPQPMTQPSPYPPQPGFQGNVTPYPPAPPVAPSQMNPPSYDQVVGSDTYSKQAPYNPNYVNN